MKSALFYIREASTEAALRVLHRRRERIPGWRPVHVTLRARTDVPSLRTVALVHEFRRSLAEACERGDFRVNHYSLQGDHAYLIVEASSKEALANGMKSIGARLARAVNRVARRAGPVLDGRYHHRLLGTPREVRRALAYVLLNARHHLRRQARKAASASRAFFDPASSARWFDGWRPEVRSRVPEARAAREVARPRTWLLAIGWRRHGLIDPGETPGSAFPRSPRRLSRDSPAGEEGVSGWCTNRSGTLLGARSSSSAFGSSVRANVAARSDPSSGVTGIAPGSVAGAAATRPRHSGVKVRCGVTSR